MFTDRRGIHVPIEDKRWTVNDSCFKHNALWWRTPGAQAQDSLLGGDKGRDEILEDNPHSRLLVDINQHAITVKSQESLTDEPFNNYQPGDEYHFSLLDGSRLDADIRWAIRSGQPSILFQRFHLAMVVRDMDDARNIINNRTINSLCHWMVWDSETNHLEQNFPEDMAIPLTIRAFGTDPFHQKITIVKKQMALYQMMQPQNVSSLDQHVYATTALCPGYTFVQLFSKSFDSKHPPYHVVQQWLDNEGTLHFLSYSEIPNLTEILHRAVLKELTRDVYFSNSAAVSTATETDYHDNASISTSSSPLRDPNTATAINALKQPPPSFF